jgi:hypothetical protein
VKVHNQVSRGELSAAVQRALGVTKPDSGVERFSETVDLVMNLWGMPEWAYLRHELLAGVKRAVPAGGAATFSGVGLCNTTPGLIVVVESITCWQVAGVATAADLYIALDSALSGTLGSSQLGSPRDSRWAPSVDIATPQAVVRYGTPAAVPTSRGLESLIFSANNQTAAFVTALPIVLEPGTGVFALQRTANLFFEASFGWRERKAYPGELV